MVTEKSDAVSEKSIELRQSLVSKLPYSIFNELQDAASTRIVNFRCKIKARLIQKYDTISNNKTQYVDKRDKSWVKNYQPTAAEFSILEKGLNYAMPNFNKDLPKFISTVENSTANITEISEDERTVLRYQISTAINCAQKQNNISKDEFSALKSLRTNNDIMVIPADKGNLTVIMNTIDYKNKFGEHLRDPDTYEMLNHDPSNDIRTEVNRYLKRLYDMKLFSKEEYFHLFANSSNIPLFYCLVKIHKIGYPIRPIVSFIASPTYNIAKFISKLLMPAADKAH